MYSFVYLFSPILYNLFLLSLLNSRVTLGFKSPSGYLTYFFFLHYYNIVTKMHTQIKYSAWCNDLVAYLFINCFWTWCSHMMMLKDQTHIKRNCFSIGIISSNLQSGCYTFLSNNLVKASVIWPIMSYLLYNSPSRITLLKPKYWLVCIYLIFVYLLGYHG
jgi:hypothetical protein